MHRNGWTSMALACLMLGATACQKKPAPTPPAPPPDRPAQPAQPPTAPAPQPGVPVGLADDATLIRTLRAGGYILALRHTHTDMSQKDEQGDDYDDCTKQRNLDARGRSDARMIGESITAMKVPVAAVYTSPFCRNKETAELAFGSGNYSINRACMGEDAPSLAARAELLGTPTPEGKNVVIVTHRHSMAATIGIELDTLVEGGALVIKPLGDSKFEVLHTIDVSDWERLARAAATIP